MFFIVSHGKTLFRELGTTEPFDVGSPFSVLTVEPGLGQKGERGWGNREHRGWEAGVLKGGADRGQFTGNGG